MVEHSCWSDQSVWDSSCSLREPQDDRDSFIQKAAMKKHITVDLGIEHFIPVSVIKNIGIDQVRTEISKLINE